VRLQVTNQMQIMNSAACPVVAMLRPRSGLAQWMVREEYSLEPWVPTVEYTDAYGNLCQRFTVPEGGMRVRVEVVMDTEEDLAVAPAAAPTPVEELPDSALMYLLPSRYCPCDRLEAKAGDIAAGASAGYGQVEAIRRWIHENLQYRYGASDATTDAMQTLESGAGVCRDFAHVGISLARALRIPARMVAGYLHRLDPMDMHAWFEAFIGGRWYTFDATQAQPIGGRVVVGYGRDAADVAFLSNYGDMEIEAMEVTVEQAPAPK